MKFKLFLIAGVALVLMSMGCGNEHVNSSDKSPKMKIIRKHFAKKSDGNPSIYIPENSYEFPSVVDGTKVTHDFIIYNKGDAELIISRVKSG